MGLFNAYVPSAGGEDIEAIYDGWLNASSAGQPTPVSIGTITASQQFENRVERVDADRFLVFYDDNGNNPQVRVADKSGTPSVGSAVASSPITPVVIKRVPNTNDWIIIDANGGAYLVRVGSGTTVTVTLLLSNVETSRAEACTQYRSDILFAADNSHIVICNEVSGTFYSALFTLDLGGSPSLTYVTRDSDSHGGSFLNSGYALHLATAGQGFYAGYNTSQTTSLRCNKITFTASTVTNSINTLTIATSDINDDGRGGSAAQRYFPEGEDRLVFVSQTTSDLIITLINASGTPAVIKSLAATGYRTPNIWNGISRKLGAFANIIVRDAVNLEVAFSISPFAFRTANLIGSLTTPGVYASAMSEDGNWMIGLGKVNAADGRVFFLKNANA